MTHFVEAEPLTYINTYEGDDINSYIESLNTLISPTIVIPIYNNVVEYSFEV